ncbi:MAG: hypothetical protein M3319_12230 [Actinomycetota bacterium]|nr:hypothetical protein [Actinomycetota bacterium]MDQ3901155.1 hypothetical protein [Actinomycetota bacterium]
MIDEYVPGTEVDDPDNSFPARFLYAFWRLCGQRIATTEIFEPNHSARITAQNARVPAEVRVVRLREVLRRPKNAEFNSRDWHFRWIVCMHKVHQWYASKQRHRVIYRGPYVKGPDGKSLLAGEVIKTVDS